MFFQPLSPPSSSSSSSPPSSLLFILLLNYLQPLCIFSVFYFSLLLIYPQPSYIFSIFFIWAAFSFTHSLSAFSPFCYFSLLLSSTASFLSAILISLQTPFLSTWCLTNQLTFPKSPILLAIRIICHIIFRYLCTFSLLSPSLSDLYFFNSLLYYRHSFYPYSLTSLRFSF